MNELEKKKENLRDAAQEMYEEETVYLAGPIRFCDSGGHGWRDEVVEDYGERFRFLNPLDEHDGMEEGVEVISEPSEVHPDSDKNFIFPSEIVDSDKHMISSSDYVLVGLKDIIARGTSMEIMYSFMKETPVFVWTIDNQDVSPWVSYHAEEVSSDLEEIFGSINNE